MSKTKFIKVKYEDKLPQSSGNYWILDVVGEMKSSYFNATLKSFPAYDFVEYWIDAVPDRESELIEGVELKTEIELTEFDRLEDFVNDVGIVHEVLQAGQDWQIVRFEKKDVSMNFRFYKNKFKDWHIINKGRLLIDKNRNER